MSSKNDTSTESEKEAALARASEVDKRASLSGEKLKKDSAASAGEETKTTRAVKKGNKPNNVRSFRIERMMSKAELARRANLSVLTVDRVEKGFGCRMDTKRKILKALELNLADRVRVFGEEE